MNTLRIYRGKVLQASAETGLSAAITYTVAYETPGGNLVVAGIKPTSGRFPDDWEIRAALPGTDIEVLDLGNELRFLFGNAAEVPLTEECT